MIKLKDLINELGINKPTTISNPREVWHYYVNNIINLIGTNNNALVDYKNICKLYLNRKLIHGLKTFSKLSIPELNKIYNQMRQIVRKYDEDEILNELNINNPNSTAEEVHNYFIHNIYTDYNKFASNSGGWEEYIKICEPYCQKYNITNWIHLLREFELLSQPDLNKLYKQMKQLVQKYK